MTITLPTIHLMGDDELEPGPGPSYDVWIAEPDEWEWRFDQRFTCEDDPDGKGARHLRQTYHCAYVAVRPTGEKPLPIATHWNYDQSELH